MFTKLIVGLDGSPQSQVALTQAIQVGKRFRSTIVLCHITRTETRERRLFDNWGGAAARDSRGANETMNLVPGMLKSAAERVEAEGLTAETISRTGDVVEELQSLAAGADAIFVGRIGAQGGEDPLGPDTRDLIQRSAAPVFVCASTVSPMDRCAAAIDGEAPSMTALSLAARYAEVADVQLDVIHATGDDAAGREVLARAAVALSQTPIRFETHLILGEVDVVVRQAIQRLGCNALFAGAHRTERRWQVASHTEAILRATDIPVIVHNVPQRLSGRISAAHIRSTS